MSASFEIQSSTGPYTVKVEAGAFSRWLSGFGKSAVISDAFFTQRFEQEGAAANGVTPTFVEAVETNKSLEASPRIIEAMRKSGANRQTHLVAVGGGITQDLSAFVASVYMRGLKWTYVPTTVLAMVDSCIGGKSSINVGPYKNLVGTFHSPEVVLVDPEFIRTLPADQQASGLIEAVKICFCRGDESFEKHLATEPAVDMPAERLEALIVNSLLSKKWFIEIDEFDNKERLLLNFGHTFGHAMEGASHFAIMHGIGVGLGIECAIAFQQLRGVEYAGAPKVAKLQAHLKQMIGSDATAVAELKKLNLDDVLDRVASDKKHGADFYALILIAADGRVVLEKLPKTPETLGMVRKAIERVVESWA